MRGVAGFGGNRARQYAGQGGYSRGRFYRLGYPPTREVTIIPPPSVFQETGYESIEPTILHIDLSGTATLEFNLVGNWIWYQNSTLATDTFQLRYNSSTADFGTLLPGNKIAGIPFVKFYVTPPGIAGSVADLWVLRDTPSQPIDIL